MLGRNALPPTIKLPANRFEQPLTLDLESFLEFSMSMSEALLELEQQHADHRTRPHKVLH